METILRAVLSKMQSSQTPTIVQVSDVMVELVETTLQIRELFRFTMGEHLRK